MSVNIGQIVKYVSTTGKTKIGMVTATPDTITEGTGLAENYPLNAEQEQVHLLVISPSGSHGPRYQVPSKTAVAEIPDFTEGGYYEVI